jgi:hypothetical protein
MSGYCKNKNKRNPYYHNQCYDKASIFGCLCCWNWNSLVRRCLYRNHYSFNKRRCQTIDLYQSPFLAGWDLGCASLKKRMCDWWWIRSAVCANRVLTVPWSWNFEVTNWCYSSIKPKVRRYPEPLLEIGHAVSRVHITYTNQVCGTKKNLIFSKAVLI